jgi:O-antigen/teichoic acid export membrane protein
MKSFREIFGINQFYSFLNKGHSRSVKAKKNVLASVLIKGLSVVINLSLVPIVINYINTEQYGIWLTLTSIVFWFSFFDIGLVNGTRNKLAEALANNKLDLARKYISTTYCLLTLIFLIVWILFVLINWHINWNKILNAPDDLSTQLADLTFVVFSFFCLQIILKTINSVVLADQKSSLVAAIDLLSQIFSLILIIILTKVSNGSLFNLGFILSSVPVAILVIATFWLFGSRYKHLAPSFKFIDFRYYKDIFKLGVNFFLIQISVLIIYQSNNLIIAHIGNLNDVTVFNITYKYFGVALMGFSILISPFWSAFTEAFTKQDFRWMSGIFLKLRKISYLFIISVIILIFVSKIVIGFWIGINMLIPWDVIISMALYMSLLILITLTTNILNGIGKIKIQLLTYSLATIFHIPLAIFLGGKFGISGVIISASIFYLIIALFTFKQISQIINGTAQGIWNA